MSITEAAKSLGCTTANLRIQIQKGKLKAERKSFGYLIDDAEVERYRTEHLGKPGRPLGAKGKPKDGKS